MSPGYSVDAVIGSTRAIAMQQLHGAIAVPSGSRGFSPAISGGRWDAGIQGWMRDGETSPCVDAGCGTRPTGKRPAPNGDIIHMGACGIACGLWDASTTTRPSKALSADNFLRRHKIELTHST